MRPLAPAHPPSLPPSPGGADAATATVSVLKAGGAVIAEPEFLRALGQHVAERAARGERLLIVHGGGNVISELHERLGVPFERRRGLRATSEEGMRLTLMALRGLVNARLVAHLVESGVRALGVSGADLGLLRSHPLNEGELGRVGGPPRVDAPVLEGLLLAGLVPVIAPVCLAPESGFLNVNADTVAHAVAVALGADSLDFVSDVPGVYDEGGAQHRALVPPQVQRLLHGDAVTGGMIPKLQAALAALSAGVGQVRIGTVHSLGDGTATAVRNPQATTL